MKNLTFLASELEILFETCGNRPDSIINFKLAEFLKGVEKEKDGKKWYHYSVRNHKTMKHLGSAPIFVPEAVHKAILYYVENIREMIPLPAMRAEFNEQKLEGELEVFLTSKNTTMQRLDASIDLFKKIVGTDLHIRPYDFRYFYAEEGQASEDPMVCEGTAARMMHSQSTGQRFYASEEGRAQRAFNNLQSIVDESSDITFVDESESSGRDLRRRVTDNTRERIVEQEAQREVIRGSRTVFDSEERDIIMRAFSHISVRNLPKGAVEKAYDKNPEFRSMVDERMRKDKIKSYKEMEDKVKNSFAAARRKAER